MNLNPDPDRIYCPDCGEDGGLAEVVSGYFSPDVLIFRCPYCHTLVEDGCFVYIKPPR